MSNAARVVMAGSLQMTFTGLLLLGLCRDVPAIEDFTCITKPRIDIESDDTYIAGYFVDGNESVSFYRTTKTFTSPGLPPSHSVSQSELPQGDGHVAIMQMPKAGGFKRIGAFSCQVTTSEGDILSIRTVIMSKAADFLPTRVSWRVNLGDDVRLTITVTSRDASYAQPRWRKNNGEPMDAGRDRFFFDISSARQADGGIYEVHQAGKRAGGRQALMRLIVSDCEHNRQGAPSCDSDCPVCLNGGVCDEKSGDCICPPGFGGSLCKTPFGPNRFGQKGTLRCDGPGLEDVPTCEGKLFCLPDPYGCSCAAGYKGIDCDDTCDDGSFGADCLQTCHCMDGDVCNKTTGECPGECGAGYTGSSCQESCLTYNGTASCEVTCTAELVPDGFQDLSIQRIDHDKLNVSWEHPKTDRDKQCSDIQYQVTHYLVNLDQCRKLQQNYRTTTTTETSIILGGLDAYSTFYVNVTPWNNAGNGTSLFDEGKTGEMQPKLAPEFNSSSSTTNSITLFWNPIPCGSRGGNITYYESSIFRTGYRRPLQSATIIPEAVTFYGLTPCTYYTIQTKAWNNAGYSAKLEVNTKTANDVPDSVRDLRIRAAGHNILVVSWTAPGNSPNNPCRATDYIVAYDLVNLEQCREVHQQGGSVNTTENTITLVGLKAYSTYMVNVTPRNEAGNGIATFAEGITFEAKPKVAPKFNSSSSTNNSITLVWNSIPCGSRGGNITHYESSIFRTGYRRPFQSAIIITDAVMTFDGLTPCTSYTIQTEAWNNAGYSAKLEVNTKTANDVPDSVRDLRIRAAGHNILVVSWTAPGNSPNNPCRATDYIVAYDLVNLEQCREVRQQGGSVNTTENTITLVGLKAYSTYMVNVTPRNEAGNAIATFAEGITFEAKPTGAPVLRSSSASHNSITFSWDPPPCGSRGGRMRHYRYKFRKSGEPEMIDDIITSDKFVTLENLSPCTSYWFKVRVYAGVGDGPWTSKTRQDTVVIEKISNLVLRPSRNAIRASWMTAGDEDNPCPVTTYRVTHEILNTEQCVEHVPPIVENTVTVNETSATIGSLRPYSTYRVHVVPENNAVAEFMKTEVIKTTEGAPTAAPTLERNVASNKTITFSWAPIECGRRGGNITHYEYTFRKTKKERLIRNRNTTIRSVTFDDLSPCTSYSFKVRAHTVVGPGPWTNETQQEILLIDEMQDLTLKPFNNELLVSWTTTGNKDKPCPATRYLVSYELINMEQCDPKPHPVKTDAGIVSERSILIQPLYAHSTYRVHVVMENSTRNISMKTGEMKTNEGVPPAQPELDEVFTTSTSVAIFWHPIPCGKRGGNIRGYLFELREASGTLLELGNTTAESVAFKGLAKGAPYSFRLRAYTPVGSGPWTTVRVKLKLEKGNMESENLFGSSATLPAIGAAICLLLAVAVALPIAIVIRRRRQRVETPNTADDDIEATYADVEVYEEIELKNLPSKSDHDPPAISSTPASTNDPTKLFDPTMSSTSSKAPVMSKRYVTTYKPTLKESAKSPSALPQASPVAMAHLAQYIKSKTSGKIRGFQQDFKSLPREPLHPWTVAKKELNKKKNRFHNILAYDHSRVVLETVEKNPHSDYVNASYINGYKQKSRYIACQGPNVASVDDMWRMVWQERVGKIVMLTKLVENGKEKCDKYWPDVRSNYGGILVTNMNETENYNFVLRTFHLSKSTSEPTEHRVVTQLHYTAWPDMKLPESSPLLQFIRMVQTYETSLHGPLLVHCSTGVGRTGTFIALDAMLEQAQAEGQVDVLGFVRDMKEQRFLMVQTLDQYKFIFDALLASMPSMNTAISAGQFQQAYTKLMKRNKKTGTNGIEDQFKMLQTFTALSSNELCTGGRDLANNNKNRFKDCLPRDSTRPHLKTAGKEGSTDYINATFLEGYKDKKAYIATQAPLPNTMGDIWRMVFDYKSTCIVMLNSMNNDPSVEKYWPEKGSLCCGPLTVKFKSEDQRTDKLIVRQFGIYCPLETCDEVQSVCHIQYLGWPTGKNIPDSSSLLEVLEAVRLWTGDHPDGPITVHCIDGVGCSGTFCTLITILDHLKEEKAVDVFQAVKKLRAIRAGMVKTLDQYQFCYQVIQTYLDSSSIYENLI